MSQLMTKNRHSIRLQGYDYSQGGSYFVTICTQDRKLYFAMDDIKQIAERYWLEIPYHFDNVKLDALVVMPNHIHGIIFIYDDVVGCRGVACQDNGRGVACQDNGRGVACQDNGRGVACQDNGRGVACNAPTGEYYSQISPKSKTLGAIVRSYKSAVTKWCREHAFEYFAWQRNYWEHVIRNESALNRIRQYIKNNPLNWQNDRNNPNKLCSKPI